MKHASNSKSMFDLLVKPNQIWQSNKICTQKISYTLFYI